MNGSDRLANVVLVNRPLLLSSMLWLASCLTPQPATGLRYAVLDEPQQAWPTQQWGLMHVVDGFPIYGLEQFPPVPYEMRGILSVSTDRPLSDPNAERRVVERARKEGGEAAILCKHELPGTRLGVEQTDYLVIQFKTNALRSVLERINVYLALTPAGTNPPTPAELEQAAQQREEVERLKERLSRELESTRAKGSPAR